MKKTMMLLFLVLALALGAAGLAEEAPAGLIGEWVMTEMKGDGAETWADVEDVRLVFTETELTQTIVWGGNEDSLTAPYVIEKGNIVVGDTALSFALDGDTLTIFDGFQSGDKSADMVFARVGAPVPASADDPELLGKWSLDSKRNPSIAAGVKGCFIFEETEVMVVDETYDDAESMTIAYSVENGKIIIAGEAMAYAIEGDVLLLTSTDIFGDEVTLVLDRVQEEAPTIIGEWELVKIHGEDEMGEFLDVIKAMGGVVPLTFTENELTLMMYFAGETQQESCGYTIEDDKLISDDAVLSFVLEGNKLILTNDEVGLELVRVEQDAAEAPAEEETYPEARRSDSLIGTWTLMDMTGGEEAEQMWTLMKNMGAAIDLTISETGVEMAMQFMGEVETESAECTIEDNKAIATDGSVILILEDGLVKMKEDGITMVFQAK